MTEMKAIKKLRCEHNMTQQELADVVGVSFVTICRYETGTRVPNVLIAAKIAKALDCKIEDLIIEEKVG